MSSLHPFGMTKFWQTLLDPDEAEELKLPQVGTLKELDVAESRNILLFQQASSRKYGKKYDEYSLLRIHKEMFWDVWKWAGVYRKTQKNVWVDARNIWVEIRKAIDDFEYWLVENVFSLEESAVRLHHRLVWVHPFPNGNGRWARMVADCFLARHDGASLSWWRGKYESLEDMRKAYIAALKKADNQDFESLVEFCL